MTTSRPGCCSSWSASRSREAGHQSGGPGAQTGRDQGLYPRQHAGVHQRAAEVDGELRIVADPPLIIPIEDLIQPGSEWEEPVPLIKELLFAYRRDPRDTHTRWRSTATSMRPTRWSASVASGPAVTSC